VSAINYALTAPANFLQQLVVAEISRQCCDSLVPCIVLYFRYNERLLILIANGSKPTFKKATWTASFGRVGWNPRAAP